MHLHSNGQEDFIKELHHQREAKIQEVKEKTLPQEKKESLIRKIIAKFNSLIEDTDQSLFLERE